MSSQRSIPTVDRISTLPDSLLCHVLSFLPTKLAVATSILSKRWKPLWQSLLSLDFHDEGFTDFNTFRHFVYSVIVSRDSMLPIRSFRIKCGVSEFKGFPKLVRAKLFYSEENFPFAWLHNVKFLRVELTSPYEYPVPTFHNLTHIELIFDSEAWPEKWKWVIQVLQHCPKLQSLTIDKDFKNGRVIEEEDWKDPEIVPECLSSRLRTCSLRGFKGNLCELQFAEYIMLNSKLLCTMAIKSICGVDGNAKHQVLVKLSSYPRGSVTCKLLYD